MRLLVIGAGGHAKVVVDTAMAAGWEIAAVVGRPGDGADVLGHPVVHDASSVDADAFIIAIGENSIRRQYYEQFASTGISAAAVVHPSAVLAAGIEVGAGSLVAAGAIVNTGTRIGANCILNTGCVIDHDCLIGDHSLIGPLAGLCGGARVGVGTLVGAGSTLLPQCSIGDWSVVGAGAVVVADVETETVSVGVPARAVKRTSNEESQV